MTPLRTGLTRCHLVSGFLFFCNERDSDKSFVAVNLGRSRCQIQSLSLSLWPDVCIVRSR
jgi:hypothetical protein